jgi:hypothetical protein
MGMKSFKQFMSEMATDTGINLGSTFSKEDTYNSLINFKQKFITISDNVANNKYDMVEYNETYYLIDKETKEYLGHIQTNSKIISSNKVLFIETAFAKVRGFYGLVFTHILKDTNIKYIFGDGTQSTQAIKSWKKLVNSFDGVVLNLNTNNIIEYNPEDVDKYWTKTPSDHIRVGITQDNKILENNIINVMNRVYKDSVNQVNEINGIFKKMYDIKDYNLDTYLYPSKRMELPFCVDERL